MIEVPEKFGLYIRQLNEEIDKDPVNFVPGRSYVYPSIPYNELTDEQKRKLKESCRRWRNNNPEKWRSITNKWKLDHPEKMKECQARSSKKYYLSHREQILRYHRERYRKSSI